MSDKVIAWSGGVLLLIFHLDFWRPQRVVLYGGLLPEELLYRLVWGLLAAMATAVVVSLRDELDERLVSRAFGT
ncbi:MAG: hypothetical protein VB934_17415 [Polyangiaceae bacterium]